MTAMKYLLDHFIPFSNLPFMALLYTLIQITVREQGPSLFLTCIHTQNIVNLST